MINGIGQGDGLAKAAIEAALRAQADAVKKVDAKVQNLEAAGLGGADAAGAAGSKGTDFAAKLVDGLREVQSAALDVERLPVEMATGGVQDFAELAARLKQSELTFKFALEVRNKLIDAYRETMRMSV
jgi:flagellar hook-basal body complex protein FliE